MGNGGIIGVENQPNAVVASGVWKLQTVQQAVGTDSWPPGYLAPATTKLYLPFDKGPISGANPGGAVGGLVDASQNAHTVTAYGTAAVTTDQAKFGTHSLFLDGDSDYLTLPTHDDFDTKTGADFTFEFWWRLASGITIAPYGPMVGFGINASSDAEAIIQIAASVSGDHSRPYIISKDSLDGGSSGSYAQGSAGGLEADSTWHHYSYNYDHSARDVVIYKDGTSIGTDTSFDARPGSGLARTNTIIIGASWSTGGGSFLHAGMPAYWDDIKFINGSMLRTGNFTAPSAASGE